MSHQSGSISGSTKNGKRWGKIPASVVWDRGLSFRAKVVFADLCLWSGPGKSVISRGQRAIADAVCMSRSSVSRALMELDAAGHIEIWGTKFGVNGRGRSKYLLRSSVYWSREVRADGPAGEVVAARVQDGALARRLIQERKSA